MTNQNTYKNGPWFPCDIEGCSDDVAHPADMLHLYEGKPICEDCFDAMFSHTEEFTPDSWLGLPAFIPEADKRIAELEVENERLRKAVKMAANTVYNIQGTIELNQVIDKNIRNLCIIHCDELMAVLSNSNTPETILTYKMSELVN